MKRWHLLAIMVLPLLAAACGGDMAGNGPAPAVNGPALIMFYTEY